MSDLPPETRDLVIAARYARATDLAWDALSQADRSAAYDAWIDDEEIGKRIVPLLTREKARVWLKDVPMKEYARATAGIGPYARFATLQLPGPEALARQVLGPSWATRLGTLRTKPNRIVIESAESVRLMLWGGRRGLRDLIWAAMVAQVDDAADAVVVLCATRAEHITDAERQRHVALGELAGVEVVHTDVLLREVRGKARVSK